MRPGGARSLSVHLCLRLGRHRLEPLETLAQGVSLCPGPSPYPVALFSLGSRPVLSPLPGFFSLAGVLCLILGALLFLVLIVLVTQVLRWRAERRDQKTYALGEDYDDAEEVPVPGAPPASQRSEEEVLPKKEDEMMSQTGSPLNVSRGEADPGEGEESPWLLQGETGDPGYDDAELSALGTSTVTLP
ncbi:antigen WC1.1-like [Muntiacus reevesi]|uniref:antigen WC1.1-like n=1 Tax=Muntiacus reevesi TaxID=9886 RepID=UPI00330735DA